MLKPSENPAASQTCKDDKRMKHEHAYRAALLLRACATAHFVLHRYLWNELRVVES
jgi:hypothetical protein